jgi:hypothetical protein
MENIMFNKLFEQRDKTISLLVKLGDCLGRSLRENVTLFSIDSSTSQVTYLTESNKVISGQYIIDSDVSIKKVRVQETSVFEDGTEFDTFVNEKINNFIENIHFGEYSTADDSFSDILSLWESRVKLGSIQKKLHEKTERLRNVEKIVESVEFQNLLEVSPQLLTFLKENIDKVTSVPEIRNAVNLSNSVAQAFDFRKLSYEDLLESKSYTLKDGVSKSIYEMICRQELVKKELLESKKSFDSIWATNPSIKRLASMIFEDNEATIAALSEALQDVPYLALASKKSLFNTFSNCLGQVDGIGVSDKDIQKFASDIFETKKEVKEAFIEAINEKYGVNIRNLQEPASFKSLANTQVVIFEALSRLAPKGSVLKQVLSEAGKCLKSRSGVECIDVNDYIFEMFLEAGYGDFIEEGFSAGKYTKVDFKRVAADLASVSDLIASLQDTAEMDAEYPSDETLDQDALAAQEGGEEAPVAPEEEMPPEEAPMDTGEDNDYDGDGKLDRHEMDHDSEEGLHNTVDRDGDGDHDMEDHAAEEMPPEEEMEEPELDQPSSQEEILQGLSNLEQMIASITSELGLGEEGEEEEEEEDEGGIKPEEEDK